MATLTGRLLADFTSFTDAVSKAEVSLKSMESGAGGVGSALNKMVDTLSGRTLVRDATLAAEAFELLAKEGVGLTNQELEKLGVTAQNAIDKLRVMGKEIPPGIQKISDEAAKIKKPLEEAQTASASFFNGLKNAAGLIGVAFSAQAVVGFVGHVFDAAGAIGDMADKLGISAEAAQRFQYAAEQSGSSLDTVGTAIGFMNKALAEGSKSTVGALTDVGLKFQDIRSMQPEDAFRAISEAIKGISDPMEQARIVTELFGRSALDLLPAIKAGITEVGDQTNVMSDNTVASLKRASDAWSDLGTRVTVVTGTMLAETVSTVSAITASWKSFGTFVAEAASYGVGVAATMASAREQSKQDSRQLTEENKKSIEYLVKIGNDVEVVAKHFAGAEQAALKFAQSLGAKAGGGPKQTQEQLQEAARAARELQADLEKVAQMNADQSVAFYKDFVKAIQDLDKATITATNNTARLGLKVDDFGRSVNVSQDTLLTFVNTVANGIPVVQDLGLKVSDFGKRVDLGFDPKSIKGFTTNVDDLTKTLANLSQIAGGAFGTVASGLGAIIGAASAARKSIDGIKDGLSAFKGGSLSSGFLEMSTGILGIVSAASTAINAVKSLFGLFDRHKGRDLVVDFAESFGGFDQLHAKLLEIGDSGEALWVKLTQGTASGNADQARRNIAEVEAALARQAEAQNDVTGATEEQAQATIETATQAAKALDELEPKLTHNADLWRDWGAAVTRQIQSIADHLRAMVIPSPGAAATTAGSAGPAAASFLAGGFQAGGYTVEGPNGTIVVNSVLNGRVIATATAEAALGWS